MPLSARPLRAAAGTPPALAVAHLRRRFGNRMVLKDVTLDVAWGEAVALVGANGAGKSTFLRIAAGALTPTGGRLEVGGACYRGGGDALRAGTALLAGDSFLYDELTASENLRFAAQMCGTEDGAERLDELLVTVGLGPVADTRIRNFSSGMRKRLALARVVAMEPPVLLLDEPYASLDEDAACLVDDVVADWRRQGRAVVMATHLRDRAHRVCDRVLRLADGVVHPDLRALAGSAPPRRMEVVQ